MQGLLIELDSLKQKNPTGAYGSTLLLEDSLTEGEEEEEEAKEEFSDKIRTAYIARYVHLCAAAFWKCFRA